MDKRKKDLLILISLIVFGVILLVLFFIFNFSKQPESSETFPERIEEPVELVEKEKESPAEGTPIKDVESSDPADENSEGENAKDKSSEEEKEKVVKIPAKKDTKAKTYKSPRTGVTFKYPSYWDDYVSIVDKGDTVSVFYSDAYLLFSIQIISASEWEEQKDWYEAFFTSLDLFEGNIVAVYYPNEHPLLQPGKEKDKEVYDEILKDVDKTVESVSILFKEEAKSKEKVTNLEVK